MNEWTGDDLTNMIFPKTNGPWTHEQEDDLTNVIFKLHRGKINTLSASLVWFSFAMTVFTWANDQHFRIQGLEEKQQHRFRWFSCHGTIIGFIDFLSWYGYGTSFRALSLVDESVYWVRGCTPGWKVSIKVRSWIPVGGNCSIVPELPPASRQSARNSSKIK